MNKTILSSGVQEFIKKNSDTDIVSVLLRKPNFPGVTLQELGVQLSGKQKCKKKLPLWHTTSEIYFPTGVQMEQTSSEETAQYKAQLVQGNSLVDITGGFGIDDFYFSKKIAEVTHCEIDAELSDIAKHNHSILGAENITHYAGDGVTYIVKNERKFDWIYLDPSRRNESKGKVFFLADCLPNLPEILPLLFKKSDNILVKTAPLLDISVGLSELLFVKEIHIIAIQNEVKELLWIIENGFHGGITIHTKNQEQEFQFQLADEKKVIPSYALPLTYLYEPNSAILKSGAFKSISEQLKVHKLHEHSHLYTSEILKPFPGRRFKIKNAYPYSKKIVKQFKGQKANITTRNFPESVASIRKKFGIKDGGCNYLFFSTNNVNELIVIEAEKI